MPLTAQKIANASRKGVYVRTARARLKEEIKTGESAASSILSIPTLPDYLVGMEVGKLLAAIWGVSYRGACGLCEEQRISPTRPLGALTYRQRRVLAKQVADRWEANRDQSHNARRARPHLMARCSAAQRAGATLAGEVGGRRPLYEVGQS